METKSWLRWGFCSYVQERQNNCGSALTPFESFWIQAEKLSNWSWPLEMGSLRPALPRFQTWSAGSPEALNRVTPTCRGLSCQAKFLSPALKLDCPVFGTSLALPLTLGFLKAVVCPVMIFGKKKYCACSHVNSCCSCNRKDLDVKLECAYLSTHLKTIETQQLKNI